MTLALPRGLLKSNASAVPDLHSPIPEAVQRQDEGPAHAAFLRHHHAMAAHIAESYPRSDAAVTMGDGAA